MILLYAQSSRLPINAGRCRLSGQFLLASDRERPSLLAIYVRSCLLPAVPVMQPMSPLMSVIPQSSPDAPPVVRASPVVWKSRPFVKRRRAEVRLIATLLSAARCPPPSVRCPDVRAAWPCARRLFGDTACPCCTGLPASHPASQFSRPCVPAIFRSPMAM